MAVGEDAGTMATEGAGCGNEVGSEPGAVLAVVGTGLRLEAATSRLTQLAYRCGGVLFGDRHHDWH